MVNGRRPIIRERLIARATFRWCAEHTPLRRRGTILPYDEIKRRNVSVSLKSMALTWFTQNVQCRSLPDTFCLRRAISSELRVFLVDVRPPRPHISLNRSQLSLSRVGSWSVRAEPKRFRMSQNGFHLLFRTEYLLL